ncbi:tryptophan halogenase family protein [Sphingosinicella sp. BN140058]|uniref:tryptophan halogenase family protein n=1 Tax=Sphingosinicella sp. BN140058 TaxID=1892855 RepID=UPI0010118977|nr:tryptophan halogenase family protein [Sphingosinicella sp. BN140058]QAY76550.1 tryptophan 7-halogenase [Sphingosinicella sp. BN140058]
MESKRRILIVGGGTAGWLAAAYLARSLGLPDNQHVEITLLESAEIGIIGVGEGTFPTIRNTLKFLGIEEARFIRETSATFKQGIRFADWARTPENGVHDHFFHPFEAPFYAEDAELVPYWLLQDPRTRRPFAEAMTIQNRVAEAKRAPKRPDESDFSGPLNYAYHFDATSLAHVLAERAGELGVGHVEDRIEGVETDDRGIARVLTRRHGAIEADLYVDCTGFRAELIGRALGEPLKSIRSVLFTNRALTCKIPYASAAAPLESYTIATAHEAGWIWDIGLRGARGIGCVYSADHVDDDRAADILRAYVGAAADDLSPRRIEFEPGYRERQWIGNCVAVGLAGGFLEPLESTGVVLIEAAIAMVAEMFPHSGPIDAPARRFNQLMAARYDNIITFLKLHYCLSQRQEPFWRDNRDPASIPERLQELLEQWRYRPPGRFDFILDLESFAFFNYQYILYGMGFRTDLSPGRGDFPNVRAADRIFARIRNFGERATQDLPAHRALIEQINAEGEPAFAL